MDKVRRDKQKEVHARSSKAESVRPAYYSPSTTKSTPGRTNSRDHPRGRSRPHKLDASNEGCPKDREQFCGVGESYDDSYSHSYHDKDRSRHMKRRRDNESPLSSVSKSDSSDGRHMIEPETQRITSKILQAAAQVERWVMPTWCHMFNSTLIGAARVWFDELSSESVDSYKDLKAAFLAYFMQQKKYVKDPVEIHNIKQKNGETIKDFMKRFKVKTRRMKGAPECMLILGFMHGVNNPELTKFLNEHVPKTMEEMMITTTPSYEEKPPLLAKRKATHHEEYRTIQKGKLQKRGKFQPPPPMVTSPPPMVTPVEKKSSNKFCDFHNDKGHSTDECMQLKKQIEELVRAGKLSHLIKEIKNGLDQSKALGNNRRRRSFYKSMYEFYDSHGMLKFPVDGGIVTIHSTILILAECATVITSSAVPKEVGAHPENFKVALHPDFPDQEVAIGRTLSEKGRTELCSLLKENLDIFAWQPSNMTGKRSQAPERAKAIQTEVKKLVEEGIMREVYYHDWLSNPVMVKKHDGSWQMCVGFTDLNKACPQDCYPLSEIDWKVESLCGYPFKCFLDAYKGYHQIQLAESDEEKTAFHTVQGVYCYTKMHFGFKNADATYQRLVDKAFDSPIGRNIKVYVDDLVVKSHTEAKMLRDIGETFRTLRKINMKLNPKKSLVGIAPVGSTKPKEELIVYLFASYGAISAVLMTEIGGFRSQSTSADGSAKCTRLKEKSIQKKGVTTVVEEDGPTWMTPIMKYLKEGTLPSDRKEERKLRIKARQYELLDGVLYVRSFLTPWLRSVGPLQAKYVIREIYEGSCSMHAGPRSVVAKAIRLGYYWPTMHRDA
uniref:Reverse transcriptase domain-containing protein n=1 Tax=Tanacetum cinerariifolium TaxID=118510 RepID=A0A699HXY3_TANCI|nr:reverse transcriptase domain-containing protein [Tanacetum cinerariifolium]